HMTTATLIWFLLLCVLCRIAYAADAVLTGQQARLMPPSEVVMWRGLSLGITMAPVLLFVPIVAWERAPEHWREMAAGSILASLANVCAQRAGNYMPFGLRGVVNTSAGIVFSVVIGLLVFREKIALPTLLFCALLVLAASSVSLGNHPIKNIRP